MYNRIEGSSALRLAFESLDDPITKKSGLKELVTATGRVLNYDFTRALDYFSFEVNPNDSKDKINLQSIAFKSFTRRIGNFLLEQIYIKGDYEKSIKDFITDIREDEQTAENKQELSDEELGENYPNNEKLEGDEQESEEFVKESSIKSKPTKEVVQEKINTRRLQKKEEEEEEEDSEYLEREPSINKKTNKEVIQEKNTIKETKHLDKFEKKNTIDLERKSTDKSPFRKILTKEFTKNSDEETKENEKSIIKKATFSPVLPKKSTKNLAEIGLVMNAGYNSDEGSRSSKSDRPGLAEEAIYEMRKNAEDYEERSGSENGNESNEESKNPLFNAMSGLNGNSDRFISNLLSNTSEKSLPRASPIPTSKWFSEQIRDRESEIESLFAGFSNKSEQITAKQLSDVFSAMIKALDLELTSHHKDIFKAISEKLHPVKIIQKPKKKAKTIYPLISYSDFVDLMNLWGQKYSKDQENIIGHLAKTIKATHVLNYSYSDVPQLSLILTKLESSLQSCLTKHLESLKEDSNPSDKYKKNLEDIFQFYAKVQRIQGTEDTFEAMEASNTAWNLGKFLKFCADFNIVQAKEEIKRALSKEQLTAIFKKTASNTRLMTESQFIEALDKIAEVIYNPELDRLLNTSFAYSGVPEKRELLYKLLGIHSFNKYHQKKKAFGIAFSPEKISRIPISETSHKYIFKINESSQRKLDIWKKTKVSRATPPLLKPVQELIKNSQSFIRKSAHPLPASGYALRLKAKKNQYENKTEDKIEVPEEETIKILENVIQQPKVLTIQALGNLEYKDIDDEFDIKDLISGDRDEYFDKLYEIEPKLQGIMKMHDNKIAQGKKVIEKNKYSSKYF